MSDSASVTTSSLAVAENRPRKNGGCVGIFFQLFDWNRRFAKKKLFSKRLLPPDRAKEASKKFGGDEKLPKLRLIADENRGGFPTMNKNGVSNGVQTPNLVARLMGLESMPSVHRNKLQKDNSSEFRPQKLQKTGNVEKIGVGKFGAEALQLKHVLSRSRKHHHHHPKLASLVKNTGHHARRNPSRLIGAATRILEPGLQSRVKSKHAITYDRKPPENELRSEFMKKELLDLSSRQTSCKNCGNLIGIDNHTSTIKSVQMSPNCKSIYVSSSLNQEHEFVSTGRDAVTDNKDFVVLNRNRTRSRVLPKVEDTKFEIGHDNRSFSGQKRQLTHVRKHGESSGVARSCTSNGPRMIGNATFSADRVCIERKPNGKQSSKVGGGSKNSDEMAFRFSSVTKNRSEVSAKVEKRNPNGSCKTASGSNQKRFPLTGGSLGAILEEKLKELANDDSGNNGTQPKRAPTTNSFQDLIRALNRERPVLWNDVKFSRQRDNLSQSCNHRYDHNTSFYSKARSEKPGAFVRYKNMDHLSPGSVLEASFSNESCCSSSLEDSTGRTQHADSTSYSYNDPQLLEKSEKDPFYDGISLINDNICSKLVSDLLTNISEVLCSIGLLNPRTKDPSTLAYVKEVIFNAELVLRTQTPRNPEKIDSFLVSCLLLELDTIVEVMRTRFGYFLGSEMNSNTKYQLKRFVFDSLIEYLDSKCGFRGWMNHHGFAGFDILIREVVEEVESWTGFVGETADKLVERDMSSSLGKWTDFEIEAYETGAKIEGYVLEMLVDEIVVDLTNGVSFVGC